MRTSIEARLDARLRSGLSASDAVDDLDRLLAEWRTKWAVGTGSEHEVKISRRS